MKKSDDPLFRAENERPGVAPPVSNVVRSEVRPCGSVRTLLGAFPCPEPEHRSLIRAFERGEALFERSYV
jgi:hypothetical protein